MEEKLSVLESFGAFKGLFSKQHWRTIHGTKSSANNKIPSNSKRKNSETTPFQQKTENDTTIEKVRNDNINSNHKNCGQFVNEDSVTRNLDSTMEGTKSENNIPDDKRLVENEDQLNNNYRAKTDEFDGSKNEKSLFALSERSKSDSVDGVFKSFEDFDTSESDEYNCENIPNETGVPTTIQQWVNHLPEKGKSSKATLESKEFVDEMQSSNSSPVDDISLIAARLSREASVQSNSSLDSLLDSRRPDPVEIFLNLGFGGVPGVNMENCRIPKRFLVPSKCKGGDWNEFLKRELIQAQNFECSSLGFRGLSGPSYRRPSAIVANIMEKLRERAVAPPHPRSRFSSVAKKVLNEKKILNKLTPESQSVLSPDNRKFLQNQGKISPEVPRRRIIFGQKSFAFARDGEFVEIESTSTDQESSEENSSVAKRNENDAEESSSFPNPDVLLKLRRSSLQKQKKVEEDPDADNVFYIVQKDERIGETEANFNSNDNRAQKAGKIPKRFFSSSNLKALERENDLSEAMRSQVEKEIKTLSQKIKNIGDQELATVLEQIKQLRSRLDNISQDSTE